MITFSKINAFEAGQNASFEELICVLAERVRPEGVVEFQRIEGSGGDGGVEAIHLFKDGKKIGYQAKFFLNKMERKQWNQMDKSVKRALEIHPELVKYIFAVPRNFTNRRTSPGRGQSDWEKWNAAKRKWKEWADAKGISVCFEIWTETQLKEMLTRNGNESLVQHWFGEVILNEEWFGKKIERATTMLAERFNPVAHVNLSLESLFDTINRGEAICSRISSSLNNLIRAKIPKYEFLEPGKRPDAAILRTAERAKDNINTINPFPNDFSVSWNIDLVKVKVNQIRSAVSELDKANFETIINERHIEKKTEMYRARADFDLLSSSCAELYNLITNSELIAEAKQCALIFGSAGTGKSHMLGKIAEQRAKAGLPTVLILGQNISDMDFWGQVGSKLDLKLNSASDIMGILDAAGKRKGVRSMILIDAINEGVGSKYWKNIIPDIIYSLRDYQNLSIVFSCRKEFLDLAVPSNLFSSGSLQKFEIRGYFKPEEIEQAAVKYLDDNGISRPNTPWLSPEFSNPLYLKVVSESIKSSGGSELPRGKQGILKLIALYIESLYTRIDAIELNQVDISNAIKLMFRKTAKKMIDCGYDYVKIDEAENIANDCFKKIKPPLGKSWLQVLIDSSVFRRDPPPNIENSDPLDQQQDLIRFAFQKFQDDLMAEYIASKIKKRFGHIFLKHSYVFGMIWNTVSYCLNIGTMKKIFYKNRYKMGINHRYFGLITSLSAIFPEEFGIEFITTLPRWKRLWNESPRLQEAFVESVKWRHTSAFSKETGEIFNQIDQYWVDLIEVFLDLSITINHPWNALHLNKLLNKFELAQRDAFWTNRINIIAFDEFNQIDRIISWSISAQDENVDYIHIELASLILVWSLTSSNTLLRDRATKALTIQFLRHPNLFYFVIQKIEKCNDPYVLERVYAAAFGACCIDKNNERLETYSTIVYSIMFEGGEPPIALLTRDYALGIIELAQYQNCLASFVELNKCYSPFSSSEPEFNLTKELIENKFNENCLENEQVGIIYMQSVFHDWDDFKSTISSRVENFTKTKLNEPKPGPEKLNWTFPKYNVKYIPCRNWISKRVCELGWTTNLFPNDLITLRNHQPRLILEPICRKYERIALDELQARLADNFWLLQGWPNENAHIYRYPNTDFRRDLEPTILPSDTSVTPNASAKKWLAEPKVILPKIEENELKSWPFAVNLAKDIDADMVRTDPEGRRWLVLHEYLNDGQFYENREQMCHGKRIEQYRIFNCIFLQYDNAREFVRSLKKRNRIIYHDFDPSEFTDGPYLLEAFWRDTWNRGNITNTYRLNSKTLEFISPTACYHWEKHLDKTLPNGFTRYIPSKWFAEELGLSVSPFDSGNWIDQNEKCIIQSINFQNGQRVVVIDEESFLQYAVNHKFKPIWLMIGCRTVWPNGNNNNCCWRYSIGGGWFENGMINKLHWIEDQSK